MKRFKLTISLLLVFLLVFSVSLSIFAEPTSSEPTESNTSSETTSSDNTSSDDTSSDITSSDNTSSEDTSSDNTSSGDTSSDNTSSEDTSSDDTSSGDTSSDDTSSGDTSSDDTSSDNTSSDNTSSENTPPTMSDEELDRLFGTKEDGLILPSGLTMWSVTLQSSLKNGGFTEGLRYWISLNDKKPSDNVSIVKDGENTYLSAKKTEDTNDITGIVSVRFSYKNMVPGQAVVVVYDWAGSQEFTVELVQRDLSKQFLLSSGFGQALYTAKNDQEWNTSVTKPLYPVRLADNGYYNINFIVKIVIHNPDADIKLDNLRIGFVNANGVVYDVNGNEIKGERRTTSELEPPPVEYIPPAYQEIISNNNNNNNNNNSNNNNNPIEQIRRGGDNEELINTFIILGTIAICIILALVPSAIVKAAKKRKNIKV